MSYQNQEVPLKKGLSLAIAFFIPFLGLLIYDQWVMDRQYYDISQDATQGTAGIACRWIKEGYMLPFTNSPAFIYTIQALIQLGVVGSEFGTLVWFNNLGILVNLATVLIAGYLVQRVLGPQRSYSKIFLVSLVICAMPTATANLPTGAGGYFINAVLFGVLGVCLWSAFSSQQKNESLLGIKSGMFLLGFLTANFFVSLALLLGLGVAAIGYFGKNWFSRLTSIAREFLGTAISLPSLWLLGVVTLWGPRKLVEEVGSAWAVGLLTVLFFGLAIDAIRWSKQKNASVWGGALSWLFFGWVIGCNIFSPWWARMAVGQFVSRCFGASASDGKIVFRTTENAVANPVDCSIFFDLCPWILLLGFVAFPIIFMRRYRELPIGKRNASLFIGLAALSTLIVSKSTIFDGVYEFGYNERTLLPIITPVVFGILWLLKSTAWKKTTFAVILCMAVGSLWKYADQVGEIVANSRNFEKSFSEIKSEFTTKYPDGRIYYCHVMIPEKASTLYAKHSYYGVGSGNFSLENQIKKEPDQKEFYIDRKEKNIEIAQQASASLFVYMEGSMTAQQFSAEEILRMRLTPIREICVAVKDSK